MNTGKENLIPLNERTKEEQREIAAKGGKASGKARRRKRTMKEAANLIMNAPATPLQKEMLLQYGIDEQDCTIMTVIMVKMALMAAEGDIKAAEYVRDTLGENPRYKLYEKRIEMLVADKDTANTLVDDWVNSIPDFKEL